uniref:Parathyroid hormone n=1 Tax=Sander lucioperca TaxID=283035 RepID=A0A8C9ZYL0_SANLU
MYFESDSVFWIKCLVSDVSYPCSRRAVTEHQLMHDRGQNIQSLKRLIWLSSAIEGLHTAQTRSAAFNPTKVLNLALNPKLVPAAGIPQPNRVESLMRDFFNPYLIQQPDREV